MVEVKINCTECKEENKRSVSQIAPEDFSGEPIMKSTYWCTFCGAPQTVRYKFIRNSETNEIEVLLEALLQPRVSIPLDPKTNGPTARCRQKRGN